MTHLVGLKPILIHTRAAISEFEYAMKKYFLVVLFCFLVLSFLDWRASYCGQGVLSATLPGNIEPDWFNGQLILVDFEGWGVFYQGLTIDDNDFSEQKVDYINGYGFDENNVYVRYFSDGKIKSVKIVKALLHSRNGPYTITSMLPNKIPYSEIKWINTEPSACFWGRWSFFRTLMVFVIIGCILKLILHWRKSSLTKHPS